MTTCRPSTSSRRTSSRAATRPTSEVLDRHLAVVPPGREDRRARLQRRGQVDAAADHGRASTPSSTARPSSPPARPSGCSSRSPSSTRPRTSAGTSRRASPRSAALLDRFNELSMNYSDETADEFARVQEQIDAVDGWNLDTTLEFAMDALRCPPARRRRHHALGRRAPPGRAVPAAAAPARPAAARRAHQPPRRRVGRVARAPPAGLPRHGRGDHPRPLLPRQRRRLDPRARPRPRHPLPGQLLGLAGAEAQPASQQRQRQENARQRTIEQELEWVRLNASARRNKPKARLNAYEALLAQDRNVKLDQVQIHIPAGPRLGDIVVEADGAAQGLRRPPADRRPHASSCPAAGSSA